VLLLRLETLKIQNLL